MVVFQREEEETPHSSKRCKCIASTLKDAFSKCHAFRGKLSPSIPEEEDQGSDYDDEQEEVFVSAVISKYMESKCKRKAIFAMENFSWVLSPTRGDSFTAPPPPPPPPPPPIPSHQKDIIDEEREDYFSVGTRLSRCSSANSAEAFFSVRTTLSRCSSFNGLGLDFRNYSRRRSIIWELCRCEGWPFGLCRKALLLPPLPKSPSESWLWRKTARTVK